jgi:hypothetical protein
MPVVLPNVVIWTLRPSISGGITEQAVAYLSAVPAHAGPVPQMDFITLPRSALESNYLLKVEIGTDVKFGDTISKVALNNPPVYSAWDALNSNETLFVLFCRDSSAGPLQHRRIYAKRVTGGGPSV